jgi:hypothetical protein
MDKFFEFFQCKLYDKETILNWELPENVRERLGVENNEFFFLTTSKEDSHEGHNHVHLSLYPTKYEVINLLEVELPQIDPKILNKILKAITKHNFDILTSTGYCKDQNNCYFGIFFSKPLESDTQDLISEVKNIKNVLKVKIFNYTCDGCCEE